MTEVIPKMPQCQIHKLYYPIGGECIHCMGMIEHIEHIEQRLEYEEIHIGPKPIRFTIPLKLCSMKNSKIQARGKVFKNPEVKAFERDFASLVPPEYRNLGAGSLTEPLSATLTVFYSSRRSDLDCALVYDCLQATGVVSNDRYIQEKHEYARLDAKNPRVEIELRKMEL